MLFRNIHLGNMLRESTWEHGLMAAGVIVLAWAVTKLIRGMIRLLAEKAPARFRLKILRFLPLTRLFMGIGTVAAVTPIFIEPKFQNVLALAVSAGLALAFVFKEYASSLAGSLITILENPYQPGDWIEIDGIYGEVKSIGLRAVRIVTPDDTEVWIPHSRLWEASLFNATSGQQGLLCVADFYLDPDHDAALARERLTEAAQNSPFRRAESPVTVILFEKPWGTHYRLKAYARESREQFLFITDLTIQGKAALRSLGIRFAQATYAETKA